MTDRSYLLPDEPRVPAEVRGALRADYVRFAQHGLPARIEEHLAERYGLDVSTTYAGYDIPNPWGKASGQLSMTARQVAEDVEAGLGFVVLKTVIAQDETGLRMMDAWAIPVSRMAAEPIVGRSGETGWTISWKGRGWWQSFDEYLGLVREAQRLARGTGTLIVPSCKYHLPQSADEPWKTAEYDYTTRRLLDAWLESDELRVTSDEQGRTQATVRGPSLVTRHSSLHARPMPLEKDFSPTLAGSDLARQQTQILEWLREVPRHVRAAVAGESGEWSVDGGLNAEEPAGLSTVHRPPSTPPQAVRLGLKLFNAMFDDDFQIEMLRTIHAVGGSRPDFFVYANRLFDPEREFDGKKGIAYGGPDLSDRNLRIASRFLREIERGEVRDPLPWSATGNITTGRMALEYALRGASSFQLHTYFQLPATEYRMTGGSKVQKALCELYFHPDHGFVAWMHHLAAALGLAREPIRFGDVVGTASRLENPGSA